MIYRMLVGWCVNHFREHCFLSCADSTVDWNPGINTLSVVGHLQISSLRGMFEYICRLYCQCYLSLAPAVLIFRLLSTSNFSLDQTRVFNCQRFLHFRRVFHLLNWSDILSSCSVSTHLKALSGLSECLLASVSLFLSAQSPRSPDTESTSCRVSTAHRVWHTENFQNLIFEQHTHSGSCTYTAATFWCLYFEGSKCHECVGKEKLH